MTNKQKKSLCRIVLSALITIALSFLPYEGSLLFFAYLLPYFVAGYDVLYKAIWGIIHRQPFDENFLMGFATVGALVLGEYSEAVFVLVFYQLGELFQSYAVGKSRRNIAALMDIRPDYANVEGDDGELSKVDPYELSVGDVIVVKPGEKVPVDGVVVDGSSSLDTVALTGESVPRTVGIDEEVLSGCINLSSVLRLRVTKEFDESTASKILEMVENASSKKAVSEKFITKFARIYTPVVCFAALALAVVPPLIVFVLNGMNVFGVWFYRALTFLVISCPCALVVSVPLSFFASIGGAGKCGILVKGANCLEDLSKAGTVVFDKTGTLTRGVFSVVGLHKSFLSENEVLEYAALAESFSDHPISESLKKSYKKTLDKSRVSCFTEMSGLGVSAKIDDKSVLVGNSKLMKEYGIDYAECSEAGTVVHVAIDGKYAGHFLIADVLKENSRRTVSELKKKGVKKCVMLTGDRRSIAEKVAETVGIDSFYAELLPSDKVSVAEGLIAEKHGKETVVFVGDGINDAPVLARADVGVAMGALGSDAAIEAADVVLMDDDPLKLVKAVSISKKCMSIVYQNIVFAIGIKVFFLLLGAFGIAGMWLAIFADVGVMVLAVLNSVRALNIR